MPLGTVESGQDLSNGSNPSVPQSSPPHLGLLGTDGDGPITAITSEYKLSDEHQHTSTIAGKSNSVAQTPTREHGAWVRAGGLRQGQQKQQQQQQQQQQQATGGMQEKLSEGQTIAQLAAAFNSSSEGPTIAQLAAAFNSSSEGQTIAQLAAAFNSSSDGQTIAQLAAAFNSSSDGQTIAQLATAFNSSSEEQTIAQLAAAFNTKDLPTGTSPGRVAAPATATSQSRNTRSGGGDASADTPTNRTSMLQSGLRLGNGGSWRPGADLGGDSQWTVDVETWLGVPKAIQRFTLCYRDLYICYNRFYRVPPPGDLPEPEEAAGEAGGSDEAGGGSSSSGGGGGGGFPRLGTKAGGLQGRLGERLSGVGGDQAFAEWLSSFRDRVRQIYGERARPAAEQLSRLRQQFESQLSTLQGRYPQQQKEVKLLQQVVNARLYSAAYRSAALAYASAYVDAVIGLALYAKNAELAINPRYIITRLLIILIDGALATSLIGLSEATFTVVPNIINSPLVLSVPNAAGVNGSAAGFTAGTFTSPVFSNTLTTGNRLASSFQQSRRGRFINRPANLFTRGANGVPVAGGDQLSGGADGPLFRSGLQPTTRIDDVFGRTPAAPASVSSFLSDELLSNWVARSGDDSASAGWLERVEEAVATALSAMRQASSRQTQQQSDGSSGGVDAELLSGLSQALFRSVGGNARLLQVAQASQGRLQQWLKRVEATVTSQQDRVERVLDMRQAALDRAAVRMANQSQPGPLGRTAVTTIQGRAAAAGDQLYESWNQLRRLLGLPPAQAVANGTESQQATKGNGTAVYGSSSGMGNTAGAADLASSVGVPADNKEDVRRVAAEGNWAAQQANSPASPAAFVLLGSGNSDGGSSGGKSSGTSPRTGSAATRPDTGSSSSGSAEDDPEDIVLPVLWSRTGAPTRPVGPTG